MRVAFNELTSNAVVAVNMGTAACSAVYDKDTKIWPDNEGRVSQLVLAGYATSTVETAGFWYCYVRNRLLTTEYGMGKNGCNANNCIRLRLSGGQEWHVGKTYNGTAVATWSKDDTSGRLTVTFAKGTGPVASAVAVGDKVSVQTVCAGWNESYVTNSTQDFLDKVYNFPLSPYVIVTYQCSISTAKRTLEVWVEEGLNGKSTGNHIIFYVSPPAISTRYTYTLKAGEASTNSAVTQSGVYYNQARLSDNVFLSLQGLDWASYSSGRVGVVAFNDTASLEIKTIIKE